MTRPMLLIITGLILVGGGTCHAQTLLNSHADDLAWVPPDLEDLGVCPVPLIYTEEDAVAAVRRWAWWDIGELRVRLSYAAWTAFSARIDVSSADRHTFTFNPYSGQLILWSAPTFQSEADLGIEPGSLSQGIETAVRRFAEAHYTGCPVDEMRMDQITALRQVLPNGTLVYDNFCALRTTGPRDEIEVRGCAMRQTALRVSPDPELSPEAIIAAITKWLRTLRAARRGGSVDCGHEDWHFGGDHLVMVSEDNAGVQRLCYTVEVLVSQVPGMTFERWRAQEGRATSRPLTYVESILADARTGAAAPLGYVGYELDVFFPDVPRVTISGLEFHPIYEARVRGRHAYWYAGYLSSYLWRGEVAEDAGGVRVDYAGRSWEFTVGSTTALVDGQPHELDAPPVTVSGVTYLPLDAFRAVTGWSATYDRRQHVVTLTPPEE